MKRYIIILLLSLLSISAYSNPIAEIDTTIAPSHLTDSTFTDRLNYRLYQGNYYFTQRNFQQAFAHYISATELFENYKKENPKTDIDLYKPQLALACYQASRIFIIYENYNEAYRLLNIAADYCPDNKTYLDDLAWFNLNIGKPKTTIKICDKLLKIDPYNIKYHHLQLQAYIQLEKHKKALKSLDKIETIQNESINTLGQRVDILNVAMQFKKSIAAIGKYQQAHPTEQRETQLLLAQVYTQSNSHQALRKTIATLDSLYPNNAQIAVAKHTINTIPETQNIVNNERLINLLTIEYIPSQAIIPLSRPVIAQLLADTQTTEINRLLNTLTTTYPNDTNILTLKSSVELSIKDTAAAISTLNQITNITSKNSDTYQTLLQLYAAQNNSEQIRNIADIAYDNLKNDHWAYLKIISRIDTTNIDSAIAIARQLLPTIQSNNAKGTIYQLLGDMLLNKNMREEAITAYDSCLHYTPNDPTALNNLAYNLAMLNRDLERAEQLAQQAIRLEPEKSFIIDTYAWVLYLRNDYRLALLYMNKLITLCNETNEPISLETYYHYGHILMKNNQPEEAVKQWKSALELQDQPENQTETMRPIIEEIETLLNTKKQ